MTRRASISALIGGAAFLLLGLLHGETALTLARLAIVGAALAPAAVIDLREHRIPNRIVLPAALACALLAGRRRSATASPRSRWSRSCSCSPSSSQQRSAWAISRPRF